MKIAVYHNLPSGGGKRWLYDCLSGLSKRHTIDVYAPSNVIDPQFADVTPLASRTHEVPFRALPRLPFWRAHSPQRLIDLLRFDGVSRKIARLIDAGGYDLALATSCRFTEAPLVLRHLRTPSVYYCHEVMRSLYEPRHRRPYYPSGVLSPLLALWMTPYQALVRRWDAQNVRKASLVVTNSHYVREAVYRVYGAFARVNYPGVDVDAFQPNGSAEREHLVVCVGELRPHKAFDCALETIAQIPASLRPRLAIVANSVDEREKSYVQALAAERGVLLTICERIPGEEVKKLYQRAKLTLYTSIMEPFGLVVLESMSSGTPVVGVREAGIRETVVDSVTGFLVERDPRRLAEAVQRLLEDEELRARMGAASRRYVLDNWTWDRSISELESMMVEIAESGGAVVAATAGRSRAVHEDVTERVRPAAMTLAPAPTSDRRDAKEESR